jgi:hypothetical protein
LVYFSDAVVLTEKYVLFPSNCIHCGDFLSSNKIYRKLIFGRQPHFEPTIRNIKKKKIVVTSAAPLYEATLTQQQKPLMHNQNSSTTKNIDTIPKYSPTHPLFAVTTPESQK